MPTCSMRKVHLDAMMLRLRKRKIEHISTTAPALRCESVRTRNAHVQHAQSAT